MSSKECYHFTKLNRAYSISKKGLVPRLEANSKAVNDGASKISFSDGKMAAVGLFADFFNVYTNMNKKKDEEGYRTPTDKRVLTSKNIEDYLGEGIYLVFDGTDIENTGGNNGNMNKFDSATRTPIRSEELKVCVLRDGEGNIHYSQYEYIKYIIANLTENDYEDLRKIDDEKGRVLKMIEAYKTANAEALKHYSTNEYTIEYMTLDEFVKTYTAVINDDIKKYLEMHKNNSNEEIEKLKKEFEHMPDVVKEKLSECQENYQKMMEEYLNGDLSYLEIPIASFYDLYREKLDGPISQYCDSIINSSQEEILTLRQEVEGMEEYKDLFLHSNHHIKNVVEFAYIIGKAENTLGDDLELLIQAAKYHDSGREKSEWLSDNHADPSAEHASIELLKTGNYSPEQIAMIKVAIRYHEHGELFKNEFDEKYFKDVAIEEGVPIEKLENTRLMCIYLKDADALDRVRLGNLNVDYLRTSVAKSDIFLREYGKDKEDVQLDEAGLAVKRNMDFDLIEELKEALEKLKQDYSDNEIISTGIKQVESEKKEKINSGNIASVIKGVRHILQIEEMVNRVTENTDGIKSTLGRREKYMKLAIERFSKTNLDMLELRLKDVIRLSKIPRIDEPKNVSVASDIEVLEDISVGMNDNKKVKFFDGKNSHTGYFKENIIPVFNDSSIAVAKIGRLLGVKMAKTYVGEYQGKKRSYQPRCF